jgi:hypothetical protein
MARDDQPDLFGTETQDDLFDEDAAPVAYRADPDKVRARLHRILAERVRRKGFRGNQRVSRSIGRSSRR